MKILNDVFGTQLMLCQCENYNAYAIFSNIKIGIKIGTSNM